MSRLVVLQTSPRLPAGLLSRAAWEALERADLVLARDAGAALPLAVAAQGVAVRAEPDVSATRLLRVAAGREVVWLLDPTDEHELLRGLADEAVRRAAADDSSADDASADETDGSGSSAPAPEIEIMVGSFDPVGARLLDLVAVMDRLRQECPWDRRQTHESLVHYLLEETYELVEAVESGDRDHLSEELGDLLLQVMFHARIAAEDPDRPFTIDDVAEGIVDKLVRRHPHVFADTEVSGSGEVEANWETIKASEKSRESAMEGIPLGLPALSLAHKVVSRARRAGVSPPGRTDGVPPDATPEELAELLLAAVVVAEEQGLDPEQLLRQRVRAEMSAVRSHEQRALADEDGARR
jgi:XTP/dITP diphosphohydrolase